MESFEESLVRLRSAILAALVAALALSSSFPFAAGAAAAYPVDAAAATVTVQGISYDASRGVLVVRANGPLSPRVTHLDHPNRLVIDFPGSVLGPSYQQLEGIPGSGVSRVRIGQYQPTITRVVLELSRLLDLDIVTSGTDVLIPLVARGTVPSALAPVAPQIRAVAVDQGDITIVMNRLAPYWSHLTPARTAGKSTFTLVFPNTDLAPELINAGPNGKRGGARWQARQSGSESRVAFELTHPPVFNIRASGMTWQFKGDHSRLAVAIRPTAAPTRAPVRPDPRPTGAPTALVKATPRVTVTSPPISTPGTPVAVATRDPATRGWPGAPDAPLAMRKVDGHWQLMLTADARFKYRTVAIGDDRLHVDITGARVALPRDSVYIDNGLIARVRVVPRGGGTTRLTIDLDQPVRHTARMLPNQRSLLISLGRVTKDRVTLDPGHGGTDDGALGTKGTREKDVTLAIATRLARVMEANGMSVQMTRMKDLEILLRPRVEMANRNESDVFVSIHANSFGNQHGVQGIETYYFTDDSAGLAKSIHKQLLKSLGQPDRGVRKNNFYVVHHTHMPAALIEIGYLSNPQEEALLTSVAYQEKAAQAIYTGIKDFLADRKQKP